MLAFLQARSTAAQSSPTLSFLDAENRSLAPAHGSLGISRHITHDRSLPRELDASATSGADPENFRLEWVDPREPQDVVQARLEARDQAGKRTALVRHVALIRLPGSARFRSAFLRLISDTTDASAPDVGFQVLRAQLGDHIRATVRSASGLASAELPVGSDRVYDELRSPLRGTLRLTVLRVTPGGPLAVGDDIAAAIVLARRQVEIANEIWAQCFIDFGAPEAAHVMTADPPPPSLLAVADLDGLPSLRAAKIVLRADDKRIGPVSIAAGSSPERTASAVARALSRAGFRAEVTINPRTELGAGMSADVVVRDVRGALVHLSADGATKLTSDPQQTVSLGVLDLTDGLDEFDNTLSVTGTLEERTLVKLLADDDPSTIDVFLINHFVNRSRQGEAFIEADGSSMANTLIFDRNAVRFERQAWVQAHELGHVLLDEAFHPDNIGRDRPWLLMDADARQGRVTGPKRISDPECERVRRRSGPEAHPPLLRFLPAR
ncbi:MAG: hypothetical protein JWN04_2060 [Myxococcaceae bacterium]|nr:hypothetical protein [Myxococcaceae bacterium]